MDDLEILYVTETSLDEWLKLVRNPPAGKLFVRNKFPTEAHKNEWLQTAHCRPESEVKLLLRHFLVSTGSNLKDDLDAEILAGAIEAKAVEPDERPGH